MNNALPLFYYPTTWVYVDDDQTLLETIGMILGRYGKIELFDSPKKCLDFFEHYHSPLSKHLFLRSITHDESYGLLQSSPMNFDVTQIANLVKDNSRYREITAMIIDYQMPDMDGFLLAKRLQQTSIQKILLTGNSQESTAIDGFNDDLIQRFVQKGNPSVASKLTQYLRELSTQYFRNITAPLLTYLETNGKLVLSDPTFIDYFETYLKENNITEYYLVDKQGSFLCINSERKERYLIVYPTQSLDAWIKIYEDSEGFSEDEIRFLKAHKKIPFFGLGKEAWQIDVSQWPQHLYPASKLEGRETYLIATGSK